jgi:hypothetical protein
MLKKSILDFFSSLRLEVNSSLAPQAAEKRVFEQPASPSVSRHRDQQQHKQTARTSGQFR